MAVPMPPCFFSRDPHHHAAKLAETVAETWGRSSCSGSGPEIPAGVLAALALAFQPEHADGPDPADQLAALSPAGFIQVIREIWARFTLLRPDLTVNVAPIRDWLFEDRGTDEIDAAHKIGLAAVRGGLFDLLADEDHRHQTDLFGVLLSLLRPQSAITGRGQFYTPFHVCLAMAHLVGVEPGTTVHEPAAGTGGMLAAAATVLRENGHDPATVTWYANDIDPIAIACLAVNSHLWDLGHRVLFAEADSLAEPDWVPGALRTRDAAIAHLRTNLAAERQLAALRALFIA